MKQFQEWWNEFTKDMNVAGDDVIRAIAEAAWLNGKDNCTARDVLKNLMATMDALEIADEEVMLYDSWKDHEKRKEIRKDLDRWLTEGKALCS